MIQMFFKSIQYVSPLSCINGEGNVWTITDGVFCALQFQDIIFSYIFVLVGCNICFVNTICV